MLVNVIRRIIGWLCYGLLLLMGWKPFSKQTLANCNAHDRSVLVFSHTSYVDFYIFILYMLAYYDDIPRVRTLIKPDPFAYMGWLLRWLGGIPATKVDEKNGGSTKRIIAELSRNERFIFLISPKGTILKREWRMGYYNIAKGMSLPVKVTGFDYEKHTCVTTDALTLSDHTTEPEVRQFCEEHLRNIVPLFPECEVVPIRSHSKRGIINLPWLLTIVLPVLISYYCSDLLLGDVWMMTAVVTCITCPF